MTHFLVSDKNPSGFKLEEVLRTIRKDVIYRCGKIADDTRPEARKVLDNNMRVLQLLTEAIQLAENSTFVLDKAFGPSASIYGSGPRIGVA